MERDKRATVIAATTASQDSGNISNTTQGNFQYKPPNNSGTILAIMGGVLTIAGDALATIGAIIQLNTDTATDFQSQVESYQSDQVKNKMQEDLDSLQEKVKQLEEIINKNQSQNTNQNQSLNMNYSRSQNINLSQSQNMNQNQSQNMNQNQSQNMNQNQSQNMNQNQSQNMYQNQSQNMNYSQRQKNMNHSQSQRKKKKRDQT
ncbi:hypothetical protein [Fredinandcohnia onubensis]|uniref:hypothetical protein n=1 Tax=Fredinandcohnia onubensis TaxID=1571209 RepID=UPI0015D4A5C9|nr:hypothetical protein [Fredinandcohnia onubensis]